jgi:hypothetical protein
MGRRVEFLHQPFDNTGRIGAFEARATIVHRIT